MKFLLSAGAFAFFALTSTATAQESASQLAPPTERELTPSESSPQCSRDDADPTEEFAPSYELQFSYGRLAGVSLGIPIGSHLHLEGGVGAYDTAIRTDEYEDRRQVVGGNLRLRIDFASSASSFRPFIRAGGDIWRGRDYGGRWREWALRLTAGAQVRLHRHFGIEVDAGAWYGRATGEFTGRALGFQYGLGMIIYT